jgi:hypothetical protein
MTAHALHDDGTDGATSVTEGAIAATAQHPAAEHPADTQMPDPLGGTTPATAFVVCLWVRGVRPPRLAVALQGLAPFAVLWL